LEKCKKVVTAKKKRREEKSFMLPEEGFILNLKLNEIVNYIP